MGSGAAVAVVTGAANGIGAAVALRLRDDGFAVAAADIEPVEPADGILPCALDVADIEAHERLLDRVEAELGAVTALVNVAGMFVPERLEQLTLAAWRRQHAVMLDGPVWLARAAGLRMAARGSGRIVNVTSVHASNGETGVARLRHGQGGPRGGHPEPGHRARSRAGCWSTPWRRDSRGPGCRSLTGSTSWSRNGSGRSTSTMAGCHCAGPRSQPRSRPPSAI